MRLFAKSPMEMRRQAEREMEKRKPRQSSEGSGVARRGGSPELDVERLGRRSRRAEWLAYLRNGGSKLL